MAATLLLLLLATPLEASRWPQPFEDTEEVYCVRAYYDVSTKQRLVNCATGELVPGHNFIDDQFSSAVKKGPSSSLPYSPPDAYDTTGFDGFDYDQMAYDLVRQW